MADDSHWLNRERLTRYPQIFLALYLLVGGAWVLLAENGVDLKGKPLGYDFITFWSASHLALAGRAAEAFSIPQLYAVERLAVPASESVFVWYYPPPFFLVVLPLALLPYVAAYWAFMSTTLVGYLAVLRRVVDWRPALGIVLAFPGLWINLFHGQNAFLTAALAGAALLSLARRPVCAGICIGLLVIKPHLALLFPFALLAARAWTPLLAAACCTVAFTVLSVVVLGVDTLSASFAQLRYARHFLESGFLPWTKMPTLFAALRLLGAPVAASYLAHALLATWALSTVWRLWQRDSAFELRAAALVTATFLVSPYGFDYDLAWLALPIAWLTQAGLRTGWQRGEREVLVAAWLLPIVIGPVALATQLQIGPLVLAALLGLAARRAGEKTLPILTSQK